MGCNQGIQKDLSKRVKQTVMIIIGLMMIIFMSGCSSRDQEPDQTSNQTPSQTSNQKSDQSKSTENTSLEPTPKVTLSEEKKEETYIDTNSENVGVMIFMGAGLTEEELGQRKQQIIDKYLTVKEAKENEFTLYDCGGQEIYCILPHYVDSSITVKKAELRDDGNLEAKDTLAVSDKPIYIKCNVSDLYSNIIVTIKHNSDSTTFSPYISLKDGSIIPVDKVEVIDLTRE